MEAYEGLLGAWTAPGFDVSFTAGERLGELTTSLGGEATPTATAADFVDVQAGSGSLEVTYDFAKSTDTITVDDGSSSFLAQRATSAAPTTTTTPPLPTVTFGGYTGIEPDEIDFSGDSGDIAADLHWSVWDNSQAVGSGTVDIQGCVPDCATGSETPTPTVIHLSDVVDGQFTSLTEETVGQPVLVERLPDTDQNAH